MLRSLSLAPNLMQRVRSVHQTTAEAPELRDGIWSIYQDCKQNLSQLKARSVENNVSAINMVERTSSERALVVQLTYSHYQRTYGIGLAITLFYNCMLSALGAGDGVTSFDASYLGEEVLALAERSSMYRPIGAGYLIVCLTAAWAATTDQQLRTRLMGPLVDYNADFKLRDSKYMLRELQLTAEHLRLHRFGVVGRTVHSS